MRKIGMRQFQQNFHKEMKNLPFVVTKDDNPIADVTPHVEDITPKNKELRQVMYGDENAVVTKTTYPDGATKTELGLVLRVGKCETSNANCRNLGKPYRVTFTTDEGEKKKDTFLCEVHLKKAQETCEEVVVL